MWPALAQTKVSKEGYRIKGYPVPAFRETRILTDNTIQYNTIIYLTLPQGGGGGGFSELKNYLIIPIITMQF